MKSALWVITAGVAVTASAMAWRTEPNVVEPAPRAVSKAPSKPRRLNATPAWSTVLRTHAPIANPVFQPMPVVQVGNGPVLAQLPPDTLFVGAADHLGHVMDAVDLRGLLELHGGEADGLEKALGGIPGVDPFDPETWGETGVDIAGPAGFAIVDFESPVLVLFAEVKDNEALDRAMDIVFAATDKAKAVRDVEGVSIVTEATDDGEPVENPDVAFVLRGSRVFVVSRFDHDGDVAARAEQIALQEPEDALIADPSVVSLVNALELGRDGVAYFNVRALVAAGSADIDRSIDEREKEMALATQEATGDVVVDHSWQESRIKELEGMRTFMDALAGGIRGVALGLELGDEQLEVEATVELEPGSVLTELLTTRSGPSPLRMAMQTAPLFLMDGAASPSSLRSLVQLGFTLADADYNQVMQIARGLGGFSEDPFDLVTGEVGFALSRPKVPNPQQMVPLDATMTVGLRNGTTAQKILDQVGAMATLAGWGTYVPETKGLQIALGYLPTVHFAVVGRSLVMTTGPDAMQEFARGGRDVISEIDRPALAAHLPSGGQSFNWMMVGSLFTDPAGRMGMMEPSDPWPPQDTDTAEIRTLKSELRKIDDTLYGEPQRRREALDQRLTKALGGWGLTMRPDDVGLRIRAGWYFTEPNVAAVLRLWSETEMERSDLWKTDETLATRRSELVERLNALLAPPIAPSFVDPTYMEYPNPGEVPNDDVHSTDYNPSEPAWTPAEEALYYQQQMDQEQTLQMLPEDPENGTALELVDPVNLDAPTEDVPRLNKPMPLELPAPDGEPPTVYFEF